MRLSCWIEHAPVGSLKKRAKFLADAGFDAMEIFATPADLVAHVPELQQIVARRIIGVSAIGPIHRGWLIDPDPAQRRAARDDIGRAMGIGSDLGGVPVIVIPILGYSRALPGGQSTGRTPTEDTALLIEGLYELSEQAERLGSTVLLEVINRYESPVVNRIREGVAVMQAVNHACCHLAVDTFHMGIEEADPAHSLRLAAPVLGHVHLAESDRAFPGCGRTDFLQLFRVLAECGYSQDLTVEAADTRHDPVRTLPLVVRYLRCLVEIASRDREGSSITFDTRSGKGRPC
jgi:sugar phosphate isomerase/epimerase